jgi:hypothetical protein
MRMTMSTTPSRIPEPSDDPYIIVPKWERFQHYKDRDPVWIKVYTKLLHDPAFMQLSLAARGLLVVIWLHYASTSVGLRSSSVRALVGHNRGIGLQLISLRDAGFIELSASRLLATKKEKEKEKETPLPPSGAASAEGFAGEETETENGSIADQLGLPKPTEIPEATKALMSRLGAGVLHDVDPEEDDW